jgi:hypothetical protein
MPRRFRDRMERGERRGDDDLDVGKVIDNALELFY